MRFVQKKKILQAIVTMQEAHGFIKEQCEQQVIEFVYEMLVQLQKMAVEIGNAVEADADYPKEIITELEKYCEQIYECSMALEDCQLVIKKNESGMQQLGKIESAICEMDAKVRVAFFPYKFSMWDSLESIWEAASRDERCECQVVPIPYYTKGKEDKFSDLHYEGNDFEGVCPISDFREYFLEKEQPDIMYIHNPYDQYNAVTMIEPRFFSGELKKHGGILVYVPYYMSGYCSKYENLDIAYAKGAINSDFIIVQSKALKEAYKYWGFPERRILALGSPKVDAIYKLPLKKLELSEEWQKAIRGKKVILLNTSISTFLNQEDWLKKIKELVETILQKDNLVLIWRPHPLLQDTIKTLGKNKEEQYQQLIAVISKAENGIIDTGSDATNAISVSHAMISDYSSLVPQYTFTGKPIYLLVGSVKKRPQYVFCDFFDNYFVEDGISIEEFLDMIQNGEDPKEKERFLAASASVENADGTCGEKIHNTIVHGIWVSE